MLDWYKTLLQLRRRFPQLVDGRLDRVRTQFDEKNRSLVIEREGTFLVVNLGLNPSAIKVPTENNLTLVVSSAKDTRLDGHTIIIPQNSVCLVAAENSAQMRGRHRARGSFIRAVKTLDDGSVRGIGREEHPFRPATAKKPATARSS
jgi:hypothetical protein